MVRSDINKRLRRLYESATSPREIAVAGMLATGSEEFGDILLPLLSSADQQVRLGTYRLWSDFHLSSLGADWQKTVTDWSQEIRAEFVSEIIHLGNGARFLVPFALADRSVKVRVAAIEALAWVSLEAMNERLTELDDWTFEAAARELPPEWLREPNRSRALTVFRKFYDEASDPLQRIRYLMHAGELGKADIGQRLKEDLANCEPARIKQLADFGLKPILEVIRGVDSEWVSQWVAGRIVDGTLWHEHWIIYVKGLTQEMRAELLKPLAPQDLKHSRNGMSVLAASADAPLAKQVFERICELQQIISSDPGQRHEVEWAIMHQLDDLFRLLPSQIVAEGLSGELAPEVDPQELIVVSRLLSRSGREDHDLRKELPDTVRQALRGYFREEFPLCFSRTILWGR